MNFLMKILMKSIIFDLLKLLDFSMYNIKIKGKEFQEMI